VLYNSGTVTSGQFLTPFQNMGERLAAVGNTDPGNVRMWFTPNEMTLKRHIDPETGRASIVFDQASVALNTESFMLGLPQPAEARAFADHFTANYDVFAGLSFPCVDPNDPTGTNTVQVKIFDQLRDVMRAVSLARFFRDNGVPVDMWWLNSWQAPVAYSPKTTPAVTNTATSGGTTIVMYGGVQVAKPNAYVPSANAKSVADVVQASHPDVAGKPNGDLKEQVWSANTVEGSLKAVAASTDAEPQDGLVNLAEVDLSFPSPGALPLQFVRYYQSSYLGRFCMGPGWRFTPFVLEFERPSWYDENGLMKNNGTPVYKDSQKNTRLRSGAVRVVDLRTGGALDFQSSLQLGTSVSNTGSVTITLTGLNASGLPTFTPGQRQSGATLVQLVDTAQQRKYKLTSPDGAELTFDHEGRLLQTKDRNGKTQTYAWDAQGCLTTLTDQAGQALTLAYHPTTKLLTSVTGPHGEVVNYTYTPQGCLFRATHARSTAFVEYRYNANCQLDKKTRFNGLKAFESAPDLKGRAETASDVRGNAANSTFTQDAAGSVRTTQTADPLVNDTAFMPARERFDRDGRLLASRSVTGPETTLGYDAGSLAPNQVTLPIAGRPPIRIDRNSYGQPTRIADPGNTGAQDITAAYDPTTKLPTQMTDTSGRATDLLYDANKNVSCVRRHLGGQNVDVDFTYTANGALNTIRNPLGITAVTINRDNVDRVTSVVDATGVTVSYTYDTLGRLWKITDPRLSSPVEYLYDDYDRVLEIRFPAGSIFYGYDPAKGWLTSMTDLLGRTTNYVRDANTGDITQVVDVVAGGTDRVTSMTHNRFGQLASVTPPGAAPIAFNYDQIGRPLGSSETDTLPPGPVKLLDSNNADDGVPTNATNHVFTWGAPETDSGIAGYSFAFDQAPDDTIDTPTATATWNNVSQGTHTFQVKAKGKERNAGQNDGLWGTVASFSLIVNSPGITLSLSGSPMSETGGTATVTATSSLAPTLGITVNLAFSGTATAGSDYTGSGTTITIPAGDTAGTVTLTALSDLIYDPAETIVVDIASVINGVESGTQQVTAIITDDDSSEGKIAFSSNRDGNHEIYLMNADGSGVTRLTNNTASDTLPSFSPDGSKIAFVSDRDGNPEIYVMNADGTGQTRLTNHLADDSAPAFGPGGTKIVFSSNRDGNREIYTMNTDGSSVLRLTTNPANETSPALRGRLKSRFRLSVRA
jgi:YD repeat-containing protein